MTAPRPRDPRAQLLAVAAVAGLAWGAHQLALVTQGVDGSAGGRFLARLDLALPVLLAVAGALFVGVPRTWAARARLLARGAAWWWVALAMALVASTTPVGPRRSVLYALVGRHPGEAGPPPALAIGVAVVTVALGVLLGPWWAALLARLPGRDEGQRQLVGAGLLVAVSLGWVTAVVLATDAAAFGPLSWPPAHLGALGVGVLARHLVVRPAVAAGALAAAGLAAWLVLPAEAPPTGAGAVGHLLLGLVVAGGAVSLACTLVVHRGVVQWLATVAPGMVLMVQPAAVLVARQHRERFSEIDGTVRLVGPALPVFVWAVLLAAAVGFAAAAVLDRRATWRPPPFAAGLAGIVGGAFVWRVFTWLTVAPERTDGGDPLFYHTAANLFAEGRGWPEPLNWIAFGRTIPSALHGPGYPLYLSITSRFGGTSYVDHKLASIVAGTAIVLLVGLIGRRLAGPTAGLLAAAFAALYPNLWIIDGVLFPEGLFAALTTLAILLAYRWRDRHRYGVALALGLVIGAAALVRGEGLFLAVILALPWVMLDRRLRFGVRFRHLVVVALGTIAMVGPWTLYNVPRFEALVPLSTNGNELHVYSNCEDTYSGKFLGFWLFDCQERIRQVQGEFPGDEAERALAWREIGFDYAREHADQLPKVVAARVGRQWELFRPFQNVEFAAIEGRNTTAAGWGLAMYYGLAAAAIAGAVLLSRRGHRLLPLGAQVLGVTLTAAYAYGTTRFRAPAEPVLCILAAAALAPPLGRLTARLRPRATSEPVGGDDAFVRGAPWAPRWRSWRTWVPVGVLATVIALPLRGLYRQPGSTMEEGFMLVFPERVLKGAVPNVDFLHLYGPGSLHVLAGVYQVFGAHVDVQRTFGLLQHVAIIAAVYVLVRAYGRAVATTAAAVSALLVLTPIGLSALAWNGAVGLALWGLVLALRAPSQNRPARWWAAAGLLAGLSLTYRPDLVVAIAIAGGFLLWSHRQAWKPVAAGALVGLVPVWVHLLVAGPRPAVEGMFLDPVFNLRPGRQLPRPPSWGHLDGALQVIGERVPPWWGLPHPAASQQLFVWYFLLPAITLGVAAVAVWAHRRGDHPDRTRVLVAASLLAVGLLPQALQRPDSAHFAWVGCVSVALAVPAVVEVVSRLRPHWHRGLRWTLGAGGVALLLLVTFPFYSYRTYVAHARVTLGWLEPTGLEVRRADRSFYLGDQRSWRATQAVLNDLDERLTPGERLLVGPVDLRQTAYSDAFFYHLFPELVPATYYIEMDPGLANAPDSGLADEVASADWLILTRFWSGWIEPNDSIVFGPDEPNVVVEERFCLVASYERDLLRLYRQCPGGGAPGPYEGPYDPEVDYAVEVSVPVPPRSDGTHPPGSPAAGG